VFLVPHKFGERHVAFAVKVNFTIVMHGTHAQFMPTFFAPDATLLPIQQRLLVGHLTVYSCKGVR